MKKCRWLAFAAVVATIVTGRCESDPKWQFSETDKGLVITGVTTENVELVVPAQINGKDVVAIGEYAFYERKFTSVVISEGIRRIGPYAFMGCNVLRDLTIPESVIEISSGAFQGCSGLGSGVVYKDRCVILLVGDCPSSLELPFGIRLIAGGVFYGQKGLLSVKLPASLRYINYGAFADCSGLTSVRIPSGVSCIDNQAFQNCTNLRKVDFSYGLRTLGFASFMGCTALESVTLPGSVETIDGPFLHCYNLSNVEIPSSVTNVLDRDNLFAGCSKIKSVTMPGGIGTMRTVFPDSYETIENVSLCESTGEVSEFMFNGCKKLKQLAIPRTVTGIAGCSFFQCDNLQKVLVDFGEVGRVRSDLESAGVDVDGLIFEERPSLLCAELPDGREGRSYRVALPADGGTGPYTLSISSDLSGYTADYEWSTFSKAETKAWNSGDDESWTYNLPFAFPFYGASYSNVFVNSNGALTFDAEFDWAEANENGLASRKMIAPLWSDLDCSVYVSADADKVTFWWQGLFYEGGLVNISATLYSDGTIRFAYGSCSGSNEAIVGISSGDGRNYLNCFDRFVSMNPNYVVVMSNLDSAFGMPAGLTLEGDGTILGAPALSEEKVVPVAIKDASGVARTQLLPIKINEASETEECYVGFDANGGFTPQIGIVRDKGATLGDLPQPTRWGYVFRGWYTTAEGGSKVTSSTLVSGDMTLYAHWLVEFEIEDGVLKKYNGLGGNVVVPKEVTMIGNSAFGYNSSITGVEIPEGVKSIGQWAFESCRALTSLKLPKSLKTIGSDAFSYCSVVNVYIEDISKWCEIDFGNPSANPVNGGSRLYWNEELVTNLTIPEGVVEISDFAFYNYDELESVTIPNSVTNIGEKAFSDCGYLGSVRIGTGLMHVGAHAFSDYRGCNRSYSIQRRRVYISDVGKWCGVVFDDSTANPLCIDGENRQSILLIDDVEVSDLVIPSGVKHIGDYAFHYVYGLQSVVIPPSVESVGVDAFYAWREVSLQSVYIEDLGKWASIRFASSAANPLYFAKHLILNGVELTVLNIPVGATTISDSAFVNCESVTSVTIPNTVTNVGSYAFSGCSKLATVSIPTSVKHFGAMPFSGTAYWTSLKDGFVVVNGSLIGYKGDCPTDLTIPEGVESICESAFNRCAVTSVAFPGTLTRIEGKAFCDCPITTLQLPSGIKYIGKEAFSGQNLGSYEKYGSIGSVVIENVNDLIIDEQAFYGQNLGTVTISGSNVSIGDRAFYQTYDPQGSYRKDGWCNVSLTGSGIVVGEEAFAKWMHGHAYANLTGVSAIGSGAFSEFGLRYRTSSSSWWEPGDSICVFSSELKHLSVDAFKRASIGRIYLDDIETLFGVDNWLAMDPFSCYYRIFRTGDAPSGWEDSWVYDGRSDLLEIEIPAGVGEIPAYAFCCLKATSVTVPASVKAIGNDAFSSCKFLENITFFGDAPEFVGASSSFYHIEDSVFYSVPKDKCVVTVIEGSKGWDDDGDGKWLGFTLNYIPMPTYNITYVGAEGVENPNATTYRPSDEIIFAPLANKQDARFVGWEPSRIPLGSIGDVRVEAIWETKSVADLLVGVVSINEDQEFPWTTEWTGDAWVLRSGDLGKNLTREKSSVLALNVKGPGTLSYRWKVNSEVAQIEDQLIICAKGWLYSEGREAEIYGDTDWIEQSVEFDEGIHSLCWSFSKYSAQGGCTGEDCLWVKDVVWTPAVAFSTAESVAEAFGKESAIAQCVKDPSQLVAFNTFLAECGIKSADSITPSQKLWVYQSFKLSEIMTAPQLFKEEPILKIDDIDLTGGNLSVTISLTAGAEAIQPAKDKLAEKVRIGSEVSAITQKPVIRSSMIADNHSVVFTIVQPQSDKGFIRIIME